MKKIISLSIAFLLLLGSLAVLAGADTNEYRDWLQADPRWGSIPFGTSDTMSKSGCAITAVAKIMVQSGAVPSDSSVFNPGIFCQWLKRNGGLTSQGWLVWSQTSDYTSSFSYRNSASLLGSVSQKTAVIQSYLNNGYSLVAMVKYGSHYVAIDKVVNGTVYIMDSYSTGYQKLFDYDPSGITKLQVFKGPHNGNDEPSTPTPSKPTLKGLTLTPPNKTSYFQGDKLDTTGMVVKAVYSDGTQKKLTSSQYAISGFSSQNVGTCKVTVTYQSKSAVFSVKISKKTTTSSATDYLITSSNGVNLRSTYSTSGKILTAIPYNTKVKVTQVKNNWGYTTYNGKSGWFCLEYAKLANNPLQKISLTPPTKTSYLQGDKLDTTGMVVKAVYADGTQKKLTSSQYVVSGFSSQNVGTCKVTVTYQSKSATFSVKISQKATTSSAINYLITSSNGVNLRSTYSTAGKILTAIPYNTKVKVTQVKNNWGYTTYNGKSGWFCLEYAKLANNPLQKISLTPPTKTSYLQGDKLDTTGMVVKAVYADGTQKKLTSSQYVVSGFSSKTVGTCKVTVTYQSKSATFSVKISQKATTSSAINYLITSSNGVNLRSTYSTSGKILTAIPYKTIVKVTKEKNNWGYTTYNGKSGWFCLEYAKLSQNPLEKLSLTPPTKINYLQGDVFDNTGMVVKAVYADGTQKKLASTQYAITGFSSKTVGTCRVTVTYQSKSIMFTVKIADKETPVSVTTYSITYPRGVNLRSTYSTSGEILGILPYKATVKVTEEQTNWGYTTYNGKNGWFCLDYAEPVQPEKEQTDIQVACTLPYLIDGNTPSQKDFTVFRMYNDNTTNPLSDFTISMDAVNQDSMTVTIADGKFSKRINIKVFSKKPIGDCNLDYKIDATDALVALQAAVGKPSKDFTKDLANISRNDALNATDALIILQIAVEKD